MAKVKPRSNKKPTPRELGLNPRQLGQSPRQLGQSPRQLGISMRQLEEKAAKAGMTVRAYVEKRLTKLKDVFDDDSET